MTKNIYWLASYPKSGNTWFRLFLNQLLGSEQQLNLNDLPIKTTIASDRFSFDAGMGINSSDLLPSEIDQLRPYCDELFNQALTEPMFRKIHDAYFSPHTHKAIVSAKITAGIIYIVRNPLDVLVSYSHHLGKNINYTLNRLNGKEDPFAPINEVKSQFTQYMGAWSHHVSSWLNQTEIPVHLVRYEDLLAEPLKYFTKAIRFSQLDHSETEIKQAIENTSFEKLKEQEANGRFVETPRHSNNFFRKGVSGGWRSDLSSMQVEHVINCHKEVMESLGYLNQDSTPVF